MPKKFELALLRRANQLGLKGARRDKYVYGTLNKLGKMPKKRRKGK